MLATTAAALVLSLLHPRVALPLHLCSPQGVTARCGTLLVPENRGRPAGREIALKVVVIPAVARPVAADAFTYLAGGPGGAAATDMPATAVQIWSGIHRNHDIVLVDQRGTGSSNPLVCPKPATSLETNAQRRTYVRACRRFLKADPSQYGTWAAVQDLEAVRLALGYRSFDVYGTSYGATVAQVFLKTYPRAVRTLTLDGATFTDVPFYSRYARNGQAALDVLTQECAAQPSCARAFPGWRQRLRSLIEKWNTHPQRLARGTITGDGLAGVVQGLLLDAGHAATIPWLVSRAAAGDLGPLEKALRPGASLPRSLMYWTIMCNEPWVGLRSRGPWGTFLDGLTEATLDQARGVCRLVPRHADPASVWTRVHSTVPTLVLVGEADPQDPIGNLPGLARALPGSRVVTARGQGHAVGQYGCLGALVGRFVVLGDATKIDTACADAIAPPTFVLR